MMSMHKLTAGEGYAYLSRHVAAGDAGLEPGASLTAYYEHTGNPAGRWFGEGLAGFGDTRRRLRPGDVVTEAAMTAVFRDGVDPLTDDALGRPYGRFDDGKRHAVVGYDLTFTAPKSVSVLWALADDATRVIVYDAHRAALASSLEFVEQRVIRTRTGEAGRHQVRTRGMVAAAFDHWDTRAGDPNLHTHVVTCYTCPWAPNYNSGAQGPSPRSARPARRRPREPAGTRGSGRTRRRTRPEGRTRASGDQSGSPRVSRR
ncbi:hypothetical protein N867_16860 [Actinotalea fermentans ATCC 43279 = JCM 9966 = DSM 3133]|nr:hypothetical protein N867_16860 [Actinotalea fermentans ATCC 43279 = JCM 9966 = DSM 3133]